MGKIVKSAQVSSDKYVVAVPSVADAPAGAVPQGDVAEAHLFADEFFANDGASAQSQAAAEQPSVDWDRVRRDAETIIDTAAEDAQSLIKQAHMHALELVTQAEGRAASIETEARTRGQDEGYAAGKAAADAELTAMAATMRELIESARAERRHIIDSAEPELVRLAAAIAERVVHQHIAIEPSVIVDNVRQALTRLATREVVTLRVNPDDLETIRQYRDSIVTSSDVEHLRIVEDQRVDRGGVVVETDAGTIDAKITTQLREARRAIAVEEPTDVAQPHAQAS